MNMKALNGVLILICYFFQLGDGRKLLIKTSKKAWIATVKKGLYSLNLLMGIQIHRKKDLKGKMSKTGINTAKNKTVKQT